MACYECGSPEGSETQLCKDCQARRIASFRTIREQIMGDGNRWRHYWTIIKEEWHLGIIIVILIFVILYLLICFLLRPHEVQIGKGASDSEQSMSEDTSAPDYTAEVVYEGCLATLQRVDTSNLDSQALIEAYKETYKKELEELDRQNPKDAEGKPLSMLARILLIRAQESCQSARVSCEGNLRSPACLRFVREYLQKEPSPVP